MEPALPDNDHADQANHGQSPRDYNNDGVQKYRANHINAPCAEESVYTGINEVNDSKLVTKIKHIEAQMESPGYYIPAKRAPAMLSKPKEREESNKNKKLVITHTHEESAYNGVVTVSPRDFNYSAMSKFFKQTTATEGIDNHGNPNGGGGPSHTICDDLPEVLSRIEPKDLTAPRKTPKNWDSEDWDRLARSQMNRSSSQNDSQDKNLGHSNPSFEILTQAAPLACVNQPSSPSRPEGKTPGFMRPTESSKQKNRKQHRAV